MVWKHLSGFLVMAVLLLNILGWFWCFALVLGLLSAISGMLVVVYLQYDTVDSILKPSTNVTNNPLGQLHTLGLDFDIATEKPLLLIPNICEQTIAPRRRRSGGGVGGGGHRAAGDGPGGESFATVATATVAATTLLSVPKRRRSHQVDETHMRKKSLIDSGIDLLFKKSDGAGVQRLGSPTQVVADCTADEAVQHHKLHPLQLKTGGQHPDERSGKWRPFETIKIYTERRKSHDCGGSGAANRKSDISIGEECFYTTMPFQQPHHHQQHSHQAAPEAAKSARATPQPTPTSEMPPEAKPKLRARPMFTGHKGIDHILHTMIDYVLRDYIESWFQLVSDNTEFSELRTRSSIEESVQTACGRIRNTDWVPLITTKLADDIATHTRIYRRAEQALAASGAAAAGRSASGAGVSSAAGGGVGALYSPQKRGGAARKADTLEPPSSGMAGASLRHRRNKSDTDLSWHTNSGSSSSSSSTAAGASAAPAAGGAARNVANSKFYTEPIDEQTLFGDAESRLTSAFFDIADTWRQECTDDAKLEEFLTHTAETILYFTIPDEDFACLPLRHFLSTLLANVVFRPLLDLLADPDFINLQLARYVPKESINSEFFIKLTRQCTDLSELRACRQFVVREMDALYKESSSSAELNSLKYTQKLIDMRLSYLQSSKAQSHTHSHSSSDRGAHSEPKSLGSDAPLLTLEELLTKELALSYYLDYLSILNLQKYVIFYLTAIEWKVTATRCILDIQSNSAGASRDEILGELREKAAAIHREYLTSGSSNYLQIDRGLIEALHIKTSNANIVPENTWFDSICKFVYEKLKNEDVFLAQFYQSSAYKKLLLELEFCGQTNEPGLDFESNLAGLNFETSSGDSNSADIPFEEDEDGEMASLMGGAGGGSNSDDESIGTSPQKLHLDIDAASSASKHSRSHSDCTGIFSDPLRSAAYGDSGNGSLAGHSSATRSEYRPRAHSPLLFHGGSASAQAPLQRPQRICGRIINTAILCDGQYAVYAIEVSVMVDSDGQGGAADAATAEHLGRVKSWHIYRRYSKFLELKKMLVKRSAAIARIPFPAKKTFQNTDRAVLEHRMVVLNEFLRLICQRAEDNPDIYAVVREFMEPDNNDRKMHGGAVVKTIETIVNPIKSGMRTIKNMPDSLVGGIAKILLGRGPMKQSSFHHLDVMPAIEHSWDYPALTSALNLLDEVFDLQARSQWLRRGIINRLLGAPWVSHATNKKIIQATKSAISADRVETIMSAVLNNIWPNGGRHRKSASREDNTKLRTRMASKIALLSWLADDLKHLVGSETTRSGLLNMLGMLQNRRLNRRLALVIFNHVLTTVLQVDSLTKHAR